MSKRVKRTALVLAAALCVSALILAYLFMSYPIKLNMATLPRYLSNWYSHGGSAAPHEFTLYDGVELGKWSIYLLEMDECESGQRFGYVTLERGPLGRYKILRMSYGDGSLYDGIIESGGKKYLLLGGRDPGERIASITVVLSHQTYELNIPKEQDHFLLYTELDPAVKESHVDRGELTYYDSLGEDITELYNLDGGGFSVSDGGRSSSG